MPSCRNCYLLGFVLGCAVVYLAGGGSSELVPSAHAQGSSFFKSSPGPLAKEHASLDSASKCNDCHVNDTRAVDSNKCLGCHDHKDLRARIRAGEGYHASSDVRGKACATCHLDHKGRGFDIRGWLTIKGREKGFDHKKTGWPLKDKHAVLDCKECHKKTNSAGRRVYLGEDKLCGSCHNKDQPHGFDRRALKACERCHNEVSWKPPKSRLNFDHNKKSDAEFPQEGAHKDVACGKCHPKAKFNLKRAKPGNCGNSGRHASPHKGHLFDTKSCDWCHSPKFRTLKQNSFNHKARTRFDLEGAHDRIRCYSCHTKSLGTRKPSRACARCHGNENPHKSRFKAYGNPPACETCHPETSWKPTRFNHGRRTRFRLEDKHARIDCRDCHRGKKPHDFEDFRDDKIRNDRRCMSCHQHRNVHNRDYTDEPKSKKVIGKDGERVKTCVECHKSSGSAKVGKGAVSDVHGANGRWPLTGQHNGVRCGKCHINDEFPDTPKQCGVRCHEDSLHEGELGDECDICHEPGVWEAVRFDHNSDDTEWNLIGLHQEVPSCEDCHPGRKYANTPNTCAAIGCHAKDDAHRGRLGKRCQDCHLETGENIFDHNEQADYKLTGAHLTTRCADCHPSITFKPRPKTCYGGGACHPEPKIHKGQYGTVCETCHTTRSFRDIRALHDVGDFALRGSHDRLPCRRCHPNNRPLAGTGNFCINCHRQDDIHSNSLSPRCGTCHNQWSFAPARFDHTTVGCNLTGLHRTLPCYDCHKTGNFGGLIPQCYSCHRDTALRAVTPTVDHTIQTTCAGCHNPNSWGNQTNVPYGRESICR